MSSMPTGRHFERAAEPARRRKGRGRWLRGRLTTHLASTGVGNGRGREQGEISAAGDLPVDVVTGTEPADGRSAVLLPVGAHLTQEECSGELAGAVAGVQEAPCERWGVWSPDGRMLVEAFTIRGRAAEVEFRVRRDLVEVRRGERLRACFVRDVLADWLIMLAELIELTGLDDGERMADLVCDDVAFSVDVEGRIGLSVSDGGLASPAIRRSPLSSRESAALYEGIIR